MQTDSNNKLRRVVLIATATLAALLIALWVERPSPLDHGSGGLWTMFKTDRGFQLECEEPEIPPPSQYVSMTQVMYQSRYYVSRDSRRLWLLAPMLQQETAALLIQNPEDPYRSPGGRETLRTAIIDRYSARGDLPSAGADMLRARVSERWSTYRPGAIWNLAFLLALAALAVPALWLATLAAAHIRGRHRAGRNRCPRCGFHLPPLGDGPRTCPECGHSIQSSRVVTSSTVAQ